MVLALLVAAVGCAHQGGCGVPPGAGVNLDPNDPRPIFSIAVGDDIEAALVQQKLGVEPLRVEGNTFYFHDAPGIRVKLAEYGYAPTRQSSYAVYQRVVRVVKRGNEQELARLDVTLINREPDYWVIRGSIGALRALSAAGYQLVQLGSNEPRPRRVRIHVPSPGDVQRINALFVDIYAVSPEGRDQRGVIVIGGAFDGQIDALIEEGFRVEIVEPPKKGGQP